jgi:hypothetical protein
VMMVEAPGAVLGWAGAVCPCAQLPPPLWHRVGMCWVRGRPLSSARCPPECHGKAWLLGGVRRCT